MARLGPFSSLPGAGADADRFGEMGWGETEKWTGVGPDDSVPVSNGLAHRLLLLLLEPGWVERPTTTSQSCVAKWGGLAWACNGASSAEPDVRLGLGAWLKHQGRRNVQRHGKKKGWPFRSPQKKNLGLLWILEIWISKTVTRYLF